MTALTPRQRLVLEYLAAHGGSSLEVVMAGCELTMVQAIKTLIGLRRKRLADERFTRGYLWHLEQAGVDALRGVGT